MVRHLRFVYPGAAYHIMARGDGGKPVFIEKEDHLLFLHGLSRVCGSHGWRVYAWVMTGTHFHLLLETPEANLVSGMRQLLGLVKKGSKLLMRKGSHAAAPVKGHGKGEEEKMVVLGAGHIGIGGCLGSADPNPQGRSTKSCLGNGDQSSHQRRQRMAGTTSGHGPQSFSELPHLPRK
jgi:REP element-mobilizing transposase RayT